MPKPNWKNRTLWTGDNLDILRGMNSECVDLIYLDPPFNSKANYAAPIGSKAAGAAFKDTWTLNDVDIAWLDLIQSKHPQLNKIIEASSRKSDKSYLIYMSVRLLEMHRILKSTGSLYLHCDPTMSHGLKMILDTIFKINNYRTQISWRRATSSQKGSQHSPKRWGNNTDIIFFYAKSDKTKLDPFKPLTEEETIEKFNKIDENGRRYYDDSAHIWSTPKMGARPNLCYEWRGFINPHPSGWRLSKERLEEEYQKGNVVILPDGRLQRRKYETDYPGVTYGNFWDDINPVQGREAENYPTQKPLKLLERIIRASSNPGDTVLDPFCGCATTCVAADVMNRHWSGIDISPKALELVRSRINDLTRTIIGRTDVPIRTDLGKIPPATSAANRKKLYGEQGGYCNGCSGHFQPPQLTIDHIIPKSKGGSDHIQNLQLLCLHCNAVKGNRTMEYLLAKLQGKRIQYDLTPSHRIKGII